MTSDIVTCRAVDVVFGGGRRTLRGKTTGKQVLRAVDLSIGRGEVVGLVGESGSGKSTLANTLVGLVAQTDGSVVVDGVDVAAADTAERRRLRRTVQMVFQDPYASLHPRMTLWRNIAEAWRANPGQTPKDLWRQSAADLLSSVGIGESLIDRYPRQLSGGQRQRVAIARALAVDPDIIVCDEPTSALDVSVQAQILNLLNDLVVSRNLTMLFISHDLAVVRQVADRVAVMYDGRIVEEGIADAVYDAPRHPYTRALFDSSTNMSSSRSERGAGDAAGQVAESGCAYRHRCALAQKDCAAGPPPPVDVSGVRVACYHPLGRADGR